MDGEGYIETTEECLIPSGFFEEEENSVWKALDIKYGGRTIKNELQYTSEEVGSYIDVNQVQCHKIIIGNKAKVT